MKSLIFYITICCLFSISLTAQQNNSLNGKMLFLNSGKTPAVGVEVSGSVNGINANPVYSADDGSYYLIFPSASAGQPVNLRVGDKDGGGQAIELVNDKEVREFRIPAIATREFEIIVCLKGQRDSIAQRYYKIIKSSSDRELAKIKKQMVSLLAQKEKGYEKIRILSKKIAGMQQRSDSVVMYREAFRLASINKDNAPKRVLRYLELLDQGKLIQEAREALSIEGAANDLEEGISEFNAAIDELKKRAEASEIIYDYEDAITCYTTIISYLEEMEADRLNIAPYYLKTANILLKSDDPENALEYQQNAIDIWEDVSGPKSLDLAMAYNSMGLSHQTLGQYKTALDYHKKAIAIRIAVSGRVHPDLAVSYDDAASAYRALSRYKTALKYHQKAIKIRRKKPGSGHQELADAYGNMALTYQASSLYKKALKYRRKAIRIQEESLGLKHTALARSYHNMAQTYVEMSNLPDALMYVEKAIAIFKITLPEDHPDVREVISLRNKIMEAMDSKKH